MADTGFNSPSLPCCDSNPYLPSQYSFLKVLGAGSFGSVLRCLKKDTQETVAVKIPKFNKMDRELSMMKTIMTLDLDQCNIVKFLGSFDTPSGHALVMEELDISLFDYLTQIRCKPMLLSDIRPIIQQLVTAIDALKRISVIHTDIKLDNIMMVDHQRRPFRVKLIDFNLAIPTTKAQLGSRLQPQRSRSPEIILGLPFSEAIDMWSLANMFASMITARELFQGQSDYEVLRSIVYRLGQPADHLLNKGIYTRKYFINTETNNWRLMEPEEYQGPVNLNSQPTGLKNLDVLKDVRLEPHNEFEAFEREQCIELLKAMLRLDTKKRITPTGVLAHPFISQVQAYKTSPTIPPSHVIYVQPAPAENSWNKGSSVSIHIQASETSSSVSQMSASGNPVLSTSHSRVTLKDTPNNQLDLNSPSPRIPLSRVILVRPAPAENTWNLEDLEDSVSSQAELTNVSESSVTVPETDNDFTSCDKNQSPQSHLPVSDLSPKKTKTKKNCFLRFVSWMKKNFWSCVTCVDDNEEGGELCF